MKRIILSAIALFFYLNAAYTQEFGLYKWNTNVPLKECKRDGTITNNTPIDAEPGQLFRVVDFKDDNTAIIRILDYTKKAGPNIVPSDVGKFEKYNVKRTEYNTLTQGEKNARVYSNAQKYFSVPKAYITSNASKNLGKDLDLNVGVVTLPLKFRLQDGDFTGTFSFGGTGGIKWRASHYKERFHNVVLGIGLSNVTLDTNNVSKNKDKVVSNLSALTGLFGYVFQSGKAQAGLFIGWDFLTHTNEQRFGWRYQGKPWISLGFGLSIFGDGEKGKEDGKQQQGDK